MTSTPPRVTVGFDIGGTNIRAGVVDEQGRITDIRVAATPSTAVELEDTIVEIVSDLSGHHDIAAVGLAVAGFLDPQCEVVRFAPHLPWRDAPVRRILAERLGLPVRLEHDANSAAWGEYRFGAAQGAGIWVFFALGTGIGAALMVNGTLFRGAFGTAPEFGHLTVVHGGRECSCGKRGCLERYASGTALVDTAWDLAPTVKAEESPLYRAILMDRDKVSGHMVMEAARLGDPLGVRTVESFARWVGEGLAIVQDVLDPEMIIVGGGVSRDADLFLDAASANMADKIVGAGHRPLPTVSRAELGADAGMIGVADLARQQEKF
ncbi:Glucokinase [Corynebacterium atrinae]|uniref:ROK family glucokinase n=1 Tax=Corynebacterium atrinae TaxID=1336740 RepID=UPI0025B4568A|nr:ROK family glucokinase [Corynebacterium atrinae]WJY63835.1 Glucokinase [Corynebacterium atrinae]